MASKKVRIQTTIDKDIYEKIVLKWLPKFERLNALLEEALRVFDSTAEHSLTQTDYLAIRMMREVGMFLMGFESGEAILEGDLERAITENEIRFLMEWYYKKPIDKITIEEAVEFVKIGLIATNRAADVKIRWDENEVHILVSSKHGKTWNTALCEAIKRFAELHFKVDAEYSVFPHGFELNFTLS
ncbi:MULTISPECIES: hypothetical protein [unclassified Archaeoglobus]|uniref:hypothetical protein n=1 Tax=unclassified Archaeoglobus TaxID=2643606 RepID=UPI0025C19448|nr:MULTISPECIES: hypothetical protein [unclassified Archaeoglobus]